MNSRKLTVLTIIAGVLALGEFGSALMIWLEHPGRRLVPSWPSSSASSSCWAPGCCVAGASLPAPFSSGCSA